MDVNPRSGLARLKALCWTTVLLMLGVGGLTAGGWFYLRTPPVVRAAGVGDLARVEALLGEGASIHARDRFGRTPMHAAAQQGRNEVVE